MVAERALRQPAAAVAPSRDALACVPSPIVALRMPCLAAALHPAAALGHASSKELPRVAVTGIDGEAAGTMGNAGSGGRTGGI